MMDYINYKPSLDAITLEDIDESFEKNELEEISRIINENIVVRTSKDT